MNLFQWHLKKGMSGYVSLERCWVRPALLQQPVRPGLALLSAAAFRPSGGALSCPASSWWGPGQTKHAHLCHPRGRGHSLLNRGGCGAFTAVVLLGGLRVSTARFWCLVFCLKGQYPEWDLLWFTSVRSVQDAFKTCTFGPFPLYYYSSLTRAVTSREAHTTVRSQHRATHTQGTILG